MSVRWRLAALVALAFALVTACGAGGSAGNKVASLSSAAAAPSDQQQAGDGRSDEDKIRDFTKCMKEHGVDIPEPTNAPAPKAGGSTGGGPGIVIQGAGPDKEKIDKANEACKSLLPNGGKPPKLDAQQLDEARKMAKCMREHGINMPDPDPNSPGMMFGQGEGDRVDPEVMKKAAEECSGGKMHFETKEDGGGSSSGTSGSGGSK